MVISKLSDKQTRWRLQKVRVPDRDSGARKGSGKVFSFVTSADALFCAKSSMGDLTMMLVVLAVYFPTAADSRRCDGGKMLVSAPLL